MTGRERGGGFSADSELLIGEGGVRICFGCRAARTCQIGIETERLGDDGVLTLGLRCPAHREGAHGVAHGGWTADVFDEGLGKLLALSGRFGVTQQLTVKYRRPVPIDRDLTMVVRAVEDGPRWVEVVGDLVLTSSQVLLAVGRARFVYRDASHFDRLRAWLDEEPEALPLPPLSAARPSERQR